MEKIDQLIVRSMVDKLLQPDRLQELMANLRRDIQSGKDSRQTRVAELEHQLKTAKEALLIQMADARKTPMPHAIEYLKPSQVDTLGKKLPERFWARMQCR